MITFVSHPVFVLKALTITALCFLVVACQTTDPRLAEALRGTHVAEVRVEATPDVGTGLPMINGKTPEQQVAIVVSALQKVAVRDLKGHPGGATPARLVITLQRANLASEQGRVLMGSDSTITGTVRLEDIKTGRLIAQNPRITGENRGVKGYGLSGMAIAMAANAVMTKSQEYLAEKLAADFTKNAKRWLAPK
ncbi:hypothetical protein [Ochrobactrum quorumnocens]|nr:hypothetical protein [[Ochrobactrum] quorumnocens]